MEQDNTHTRVVKITRNDDGDKVESPKWCYVADWGDADRTLCTGEAFGIGEGTAEYEERDGKITCPSCIRIIKEIKKAKF